VQRIREIRSAVETVALERLDRHGAVSRLPSWQHFVLGVEESLERASDTLRA
jgi:hypothetical protein